MNGVLSILEPKMLGMSISMKTTRTITYPSISVCVDAGKIFVDGKIFESQEYKERANDSTSYSSPDVAETLHHISAMDTNGTWHDFYPGDW